MFKHYKRWRHTRGYGVHSPFAYRLITEAIHPKHGYVYYAELGPGMTPLQRTLLRMDIFLRQECGESALDDFKKWESDPARPLLMVNPDTDIRTRTEKILRKGNHGLLLNSRKYIFALAREEMILVTYDIL